MRGCHAAWPGHVVKTLVAVALVSVATLSAGCSIPVRTAQSGEPLRADESYDGSSVVLVRGAELAVALEGNPSTGFDWKVTGSLPAQLVSKSEAFEPGRAQDVVGASGTRVFTYTAAASGTGVLDLEYVRSWEKGVPPEKTFELTIIVR